MLGTPAGVVEARFASASLKDGLSDDRLLRGELVWNGLSDRAGARGDPRPRGLASLGAEPQDSGRDVPALRRRRVAGIIPPPADIACAQAAPAPAWPCSGRPAAPDRG